MSTVVRTIIAGRGRLLPSLGIALAACAALGGCAGRNKDFNYAPSSFNVEPDQDLTFSRDHRFAPSDLISVAVYRAPELSGDYRVDGLGNVMMPLVGQIQVQGMTLDAFAAELRKRLGSKYYVNPDISVSLKESPNSSVTLLGHVGNQGVYKIPDRTTLTRAIALGSGLSGGANPRRVYVFRQIDGQRMAAGFDYSEILKNRMEDPVIYPSDVIVVDGNNLRGGLRDAISTIPILALFRPFLY